MKRFICEAKTSGPIESATLVVKADCSEDARDILVDTLGLGAMEIRVMREARDAIDSLDERPTKPNEESLRAACLERDQRARNV